MMYAQQQQQQQAAQPQMQVPLPPTDLATKDRIDKLVNYLLRNGHKFEEVIREKQRANPEFSFLFGGPSQPYYQWRLWLMNASWTGAQVDHQLTISHPQAMAILTAQASPADNATAIQQPSIQATALIPAALEEQSYKDFGIKAPLNTLGLPAYTGPATAMDASTETEMMSKLTGLSGAKESIRTARKWIMGCFVGHEGRVAEIFAGVFDQLKKDGAEFTKKLHITYLLNELLHNTFKKRTAPEELDDFALAMAPHLLAIVDTASRDHTAEEKEKITKVLQIWAQRNIYKSKFIKKNSRSCGPRDPISNLLSTC